MGKRFSTGERDTTKFDRDMERAFESRASVYRRHNRKAELEREIELALAEKMESSLDF